MSNIEEYNDNNSAPEINFTEHWTDLILQEELNRGAILREQKVKKNVYEDFYGQKNEVFYRPSTSKTNQVYEVYRKQTCCKFKTKKRNTKSCPIRTAELAVPSKRLCIDTWRTKSNVIPNFMVERLKQRVMDEKPIVEISDAINYFKRTKTKSRRRYITTSRSTNESNRINKIKILCAIFGYKIIHKLLKPMNISLTSSLDRINNIVKKEIITLLKYKNQRRRNIKNEEILDEVSRQITFWITNIMDETDYKLLKENLQELEEQEGPALDFIDELVDRVLSICAPPSRHEIYEKLPEKNLSISLMSPVESDDEIIVKVVQSNVKLLIEGIYLDLLKDAEELMEQNHVNNLLYEEVSKLQKGIGKVPSIISDHSENITEYLRQYLEATIKEIPDRLIVDEIQRQDDKNEDLLIENYGGKKEQDTMPKFYSKEFNDYMVDFPDILAKEKKSEMDLGTNEQSNKLSMDSKARPLDVFISTPQVNDAFSENFEEKENTILHEFEIDKNISLTENAEKKGSHDILETENKIDNVTDIDRESFTKNNETIREVDNNFQFMDAEDKNLYLFHRNSDTTQIIENVLNKILDLVSKEFTFDDDNDTGDINKKVKFSAIGNALKTELPAKQSSHELLLQKASSDNLKVQIAFAPPNENLLSNADESWPQDMPLPTLKVTESVNKSVTSLGKIFEANEKEISSESSYVTIQSSGVLIDSKLASISDDNKINDKPLTPFQNEKEIIKVINKKDKMAIVKPQPKGMERKRRVDNKKNKSGYIKRDVNPRGLIKNNIKTAVNKNYNKIVIQKIDNSAKIIKPDSPRKHDMRLQSKTKTQYETNFKSKVVNKEKRKHIDKTGPTIIIKKHTVPKTEVKKMLKPVSKTVDKISNEAQGDNCKEQNDKAGSHENLLLEDDETKLKRTEMRKIDDCKIHKWCKGLENVIENLEIWNVWMNSTCKCVTYLKQKEKFKSSRTEEMIKRKWKTLHRNIRQDRILWKDIKRRNEDGLRRFQKIYNYIKTGETKFPICDCNNL